MTFSEKVYETVCQIPHGKVCTYGRIAALAGNPRACRIVGYALHRNPRPAEIPCHRVVFQDGRLAAGFAFGGEEVQRNLLKEEGVVFLPDGRVDLTCCLWP